MKATSHHLLIFLFASMMSLIATGCVGAPEKVEVFEGRDSISFNDWIIKLRGATFSIRVKNDSGDVVEDFSGSLRVIEKGTLYQILPDKEGKRYFPFQSEHGYQMRISRKNDVRTVVFPCSDSRGRDIEIALGKTK